MKRIILLLVFLQLFLYANVDLNKKAITITITDDITIIDNIVAKLNKYDIYIYKTQTTDTPYYIAHIVNIKNSNFNSTLKDIQKKYIEASIPSKRRFESLASNRYKNNIFIKASKKREKKVNLKSLYTVKKEDKAKVNYFKTKIDTTKKAIFLTYPKNKKAAVKLLKKYKHYDLYIENVKGDNILSDKCCSIYIINIKPDDINYLLKKVKKDFPLAKEELSIKVKYLKENAQYSKYITKIGQKNTIDTTKKAITISLAATFNKAKNVAKKLKYQNIYIYQTQTTKTLYYVVYAVNIEKSELKSTLKEIRRVYKDAYISSNKRIKKLASNNFKENTLINPKN